MHSGAYGCENDMISGMQCLPVNLLPQYQVEKGGDRGHAAVSQPVDGHGHNTVGYLIYVVQLKKTLQYCIIQFFVGLMDQHLADIGQLKTRIFNALFYQPGTWVIAY